LPLERFLVSKSVNHEVSQGQLDLTDSPKREHIFTLLRLLLPSTYESITDILFACLA